MNSETRNRCSSVKSFVICFYCNETFRALSALLKHICSGEQKNTLDLEPLDDFSDINSIDLDQEDSVFSADLVGETLLETTTQEITESNANIINENSFSEIGYEKTLSNATGQENAELSTDASEEILLELNSEVVGVVTKLVIDVSHKLLTETRPDVSDVITEVEPNANEDCNITSPDLVSKVLQYYEKQTNPDIPDNFCKSPPVEVEFQSAPVEVEFQSPCSQLPAVESCSLRQNDTQIELNATDNSNAGLTLEKECEIYGETVTQNINVETLEPQASNIVDSLSPRIESITNNNVKLLESEASNIHCSLSFSVESDSSNMISRSSSVEMDLDSLGCGDDQAPDSDDSETSFTLFSEKESDSSKHNQVLVDLPTSDNTVKSLLEKGNNITNQNAKIVKSCYVKVQDIFLKLRNAKVSPRMILSSKTWYVCDVCNKFFRLRRDLNTHYLSHSTAKPYMCKICNKSFLKESNLFTHNFAHSFKKYHACSVCKMSFTKRSLLLTHKLTHTKEKQYACDTCGKFYSLKSLKEHYLTHSDSRPFVCAICSQAFTLKRYLRKHYNSHNKNEKLSCDLCFRTFKRKDHLKDHYNIHMNNKPHKCKMCDEAFHLLLNLNNHYVSAHRNEMPFPESVETTVEGRFKCDLCFKTFKRKNNLEEHYNIHTNNRPYKCEICDKAFHFLQSLNNHYGVVHKMETALKFPRRVKTSTDCTPLVVNPAIVYVKKDPFYYSTRRKSSNPRKLVQPNSDF